MPLTSDSDIAHLLRSVRIIALVGASPKQDRPSWRVMGMLLRHGYHVIPVNPGLAGQYIHGQQVVSALTDISGPIDMVDIFRNSEAAGAAIDEAIAIGARSVWTQLGVINEAATARAEAARLSAVVDRCPAIEIPRLGIAPIAS